MKITLVGKKEILKLKGKTAFVTRPNIISFQMSRHA